VKILKLPSKSIEKEGTTGKEEKQAKAKMLLGARVVGGKELCMKYLFR